MIPDVSQIGPVGKMHPAAPPPRRMPRPFMCVVELTLNDDTRAAIIACYLHYKGEEHANAWRALSKLPTALPHQLIIMGGDHQGGRSGPSPKDATVRTLPLKRWT
jgi:hypothetical protein